ncbi:hypothetical protein [Flavobacterium sp.]|uniref:hypothetical protein n=1 Tax=Flavobacterium sp. TaxID=239 RepID=UPI00262F726C|nr:hypothetical protein [Flavobacterium sp.]
MAFLTDLAKSFAYAAARQAGRNYSNSQNNLYVASVNQTQYQTPTDINALKEDKEYIVIKWFWATVLAFLIPFVGSGILLYRSYINYTKDYKLMYYMERQNVYKSDARYRNGLRSLGYRNAKVQTKVDIDQNKKTSNRIKACGYFIIGFATLFFYIIVLSQ